MGKITLKEDEKLSGLLWINSTGRQSMKEERINEDGGRWAYSLRRGTKVALISEDEQVALYDNKEEAINALMNTFGAGHYIIGGCITGGHEVEEKTEETDPVDSGEEKTEEVEENAENTAPTPDPEPEPEPEAPAEENPEDAPEPTEEDTKE